MFAKGIGMSILDAMAAGIAERGHVAWESLTEGEKIAARETARAALKAAGALGWKLVPVEPTPMMAGMGENTIIKQHRRAGIALEELSPNGDPHGYCGAVETYRAMIAASPSIEEKKP